MNSFTCYLDRYWHRGGVRIVGTQYAAGSVVSSNTNAQFGSREIGRCLSEDQSNERSDCIKNGFKHQEASPMDIALVVHLSRLCSRIDHGRRFYSVHHCSRHRIWRFQDSKMVGSPLHRVLLIGSNHPAIESGCHRPSWNLKAINHCCILF